MQKKPTVVIVPADSHSGSPFGLMKLEPWNLVDGGTYYPSQSKSHSVIWDQFVEVADLMRTKFRKYRKIVIHDGDAVEGDHHHTVQLASPRVEEHVGMHTAAMEWFLKRIRFGDSDLLYYIAGTEAHVGAGARSENDIAKELGAIPFRPGTAAQEYKDGRYVWPRLLLDVNGVLFDIAHHPEVGRGRRAWTTTNALRSYITSLYFSTIDRSQRVPRYWLRAHRHIYTPSGDVGGRQGLINAFILPALQTKTDYTYRVAPGELATIGVWYAVVEPDGSTFCDCKYVEFAEDEIITA